MSLQNAIVFIRNVNTNKSLRKACYSCKTKEELFELLHNEGIGFTQFEFEEAINVSLVKCQTYEEADEVKQAELWFNLFT